MIDLFFFFFSSRRRHTRYWRDWSSDVCSSDLHMPEARYERPRDALRFQRDHFHETPAVIVACYELAGWSARLRGEWRRFGRALRGLGPRRAATVVSGATSFGGRSEAASVYPGV